MIDNKGSREVVILATERVDKEKVEMNNIWFNG